MELNSFLKNNGYKTTYFVFHSFTNGFILIHRLYFYFKYYLLLQFK